MCLMLKKQIKNALPCVVFPELCSIFVKTILCWGSVVSKIVRHEYNQIV